MTLFYLGAAVLVVLALVFALWPLITTRFQKAVAARHNRQSVNVALYRDHLSELERSLEQGIMDEAQFEQLKQELERNLLEDSNDTEEVVVERRGNVVVYSVAVLVIIPLAAVFTYQSLGNKVGWQLKEKLAEQAQLEQRVLSGDSSLEQQLIGTNRELVAKLDRFVTRFPDDLQTKLLLARSALDIGDLDKAIENYQQILEKEPEAAQVMAELAQAVFIKADNRAVPVVGMLAERSIAIQPNNPMALGLLGIFNFQNNNYAQAIDFWEKAVAVYPQGSPNAQALQNGIEQARLRLAATSSSGPVAGQPDDDAHQDTAAPKVKVAVSLAKDVPVKPDYAVFVYARAWQGPKLPLAIARLTASQLPLTLELNDSMAMAPGMNLSSVEQVELVARLSPSGNAIAQSDDWEVTLGPIQPQSQSATVYPLTIARPIVQ